MKADIGQLEKLLELQQWQRLQEIDIESLEGMPDCVFYNDYAVAGMIFVDESYMVNNIWAECQSYMAKLRSIEQVGMFKDMYLIFFVPEIKTEDISEIKSIENNTYVCRKICVEFQEKSMEELLSKIPLLTLTNKILPDSGSLKNKLNNAEQPNILNESILNDLLKRSPEKVLDNIIEGRYNEVISDEDKNSGT